MQGTDPAGAQGWSNLLSQRPGVSRLNSELRNCVKVEPDVPGVPVPNRPYGLCGRKATLDIASELRNCVKVESRGGRPGSPVPNSPIISVDVKQYLKKAVV